MKTQNYDLSRNASRPFGPQAARDGLAMLRSLCLAVLCPIALTFTVAGAVGDLDPTFGTGGKVTTSFGSGPDGGNDMALQSDGKIVTAGHTFNGSNNDLALVRHHADGSLDTSFGSNGDGKVTTDFGNTDDYGQAMALQSDGKIIVAGASRGVTFALARYNANGTPDTNFGNSGKTSTSFGGGSEGASDVVVQPDGRIIVVGSSNAGSCCWFFALVRFNANGSLDTSFGPSGNGKVTTDFSGADDVAIAIVLQPDGKFVVAGYANGRSGDGENSDFALARYHANGTLDTSFGGGGTGKVITDLGGTENIFALALQSDGKIVVAGRAKIGGNSDFALARYNANGSLDTTFGTSGKVTTDLGGNDDRVQGMVLQSDGRIVVAGQNNSDVALARYLANGSLDTTFGSGGKRTTDFGGTEQGNDLALQADGRLVVAGSSDAGGAYDFVLARYFMADSPPTPVSIEVTPSVGNLVVGETLQFTATGRYSDGSSRPLTGGAGFWESKSPLPTARRSTQAVNINGLLYVAGGHNGTTVSGKLEAYTPASDSWSSLPALPNTAGDGGTAAVFDGKLYLVGGWNTRLPTSFLHVFDPGNNAWTTRAAMPILSACSVGGVIEGKLYVMTPCDGFNGWRQFLHAYDPATDTWTAKPSIPSVHVNAAAGVIGGKLYVASGSNGSVPTSTLEVYDPVTNTWSTRSPMPTARQNLVGAVLNDKLYALGGNNGSADVTTVEVYDPASDTWSAALPLKSARSSMTAAVADGKVYLVGGSSGNNTLATLEVFTPGEVTWSSSAPNVATVNASGLATALAPGSATLAARTGNLTGRAEIRVAVPPGNRTLRLGNVTGTAGSLVKLPVELVSQGDENTVAFSVSWDPALLSFDSVTAGLSLPAGAALVSNTGAVSNGRLGVLLALPAGQKFSAGTIQLVTVSLRIAANTASSAQAKVSFGDQPVAREIVSPNVDILQAAYSDGIVSIQRGFEADLSPRPDGDQRVTASDYTLLGRIVAGLIAVTDLSESEFIRADCAPRTTLGDGRITAADWTQSARYVVGLESAPLGGGPGPAAGGAVAPQSVRKSAHGARLVRVGAAQALGAALVTVPVEVVAQGNENTLAFSLDFDSRVLSYETAVLSAVPANTVLVVNANQSAVGKLGVLVALPAAQNLTPGTRELLRVTYRVGADAKGDATIAFGDQPVGQEVVSANVEDLPARFVPGTVGVSRIRPVLNQSEWSKGFSFSISGSRGKTYRIESSPDLNLGQWTTKAAVTLTNSTQRWVDSAPAQGQRFYRVLENSRP